MNHRELLHQFDATAAQFRALIQENRAEPAVVSNMLEAMQAYCKEQNKVPPVPEPTPMAATPPEKPKVAKTDK